MTLKIEKLNEKLLCVAAGRRSGQEEEPPGGGGFRDSGHPGCPSPLGHVR